uniref:Chromosome 19 open reading frame 44 n=1 Tax=Pavo cristatus TaxID=9049 RepID=A0A8C9FJU3_PAVCR
MCGAGGGRGPGRVTGETSLRVFARQGRGAAPLWATTASGRCGLPRSCAQLRGDGAELEGAGGAPLGRSRFLKVRSGEARGQQRGPAARGGEATSAQLSASHARSNSALRKVAQLQSKILNRKKQLELQSTELGRKPLDEDSSSASSLQHRARGKKYLKGCAAVGRNVAASEGCSEEEESAQSPKRIVTVLQQLGLDSGEKQMREFMGNSLEFSNGRESQRCVTTDSRWSGKSKTPGSPGTPPPSQKEVPLTEVSKVPSLHGRDSEKNVLGGSNLPRPSPASRSRSARRNANSQSLSSSMKGNTVKMTLPRRGNVKQSKVSSGSGGSEIKSLDELFSKADDVEDSTSTNVADFRQNILSLDDLASDISEMAEFKQQGTDIQISQETNRNPRKDTFPVEKDPTFPKISAEIGAADSSERDTEEVTEAEIPEHLGEVPADFSRLRQDYPDRDDRTLNSEYSEDFEQSPSTTDRETVSKMAEEHSESCTYSGKDPSPSASPPSLTREGHKRVHRAAVKETAAQTVDFPFTYCWPKTHSPAVLGLPVGSSYVDPVPITSHVISMDAVEALTAYSPSVLVLNAMLKQHLMLTQQFVENIQHLHLSLVESLENEKFHYHTLEEAKEYIKNHKSPPLTTEQAFEEIQKAEEMLPSS